MLSLHFRLCIRRKNGLDRIRDQIPRPEGSVPCTPLPTWHELPMHAKIPLLPSPPGYFKYTRGKLGTPVSFDIITKLHFFEILRKNFKISNFFSFSCTVALRYSRTGTNTTTSALLMLPTTRCTMLTRDFTFDNRPSVDFSSAKGSFPTRATSSAPSRN
jgi:hypothetical protein